MIKTVYTLLIRIYRIAILFVSIFNPKAKLKITGVRTSLKELSENRDSNYKSILIHCASQGEHEQALPIIRWILNQTEYHIVISFFSPSGYINSHYQDNNRISKIYLPFDIPSEISSLISSINPKKVIIVKNEWWWNMLRELKKKKIDTFLISSTIRKHHYFIKYPITFFKNSLKAFSTIFVVDEDSRKNIDKSYKNKIVVAGDTRIDQVNFNKSQRQSLEQSSQNNNAVKVIVYGSVWTSDVEGILKLIALNPEACHLIYPHDLSDNNTTRLNNLIRGSILINKIDKLDSGINIINKMGQLKFAYQLASFAYIGGGFGSGIHNVLEAAVYDIPTIFGPNYVKSNEAIDLIQKGCSFSFKEITELDVICEKINEEKIINEIESKLKSYFSPKHSPTELICQEIFNKKDVNV